MNWLAVVIAAGWAGFASVAYLHALRVQRMMIELCSQLREPVSTLAPRDYDG